MLSNDTLLKLPLKNFLKIDLGEEKGLIILNYTQKFNVIDVTLSNIFIQIVILWFKIIVAKIWKKIKNMN